MVLSYQNGTLLCEGNTGTSLTYTNKSFYIYIWGLTVFFFFGVSSEWSSNQRDGVEVMCNEWSHTLKASKIYFHFIIIFFGGIGSNRPRPKLALDKTK